MKGVKVSVSYKGEYNITQREGTGVRAHKSASPGFTIIEVMLVLVIAALIIVVIFLAVPALQRNSRNNRRDKDAALIAQAINECSLNNNRRWTSCDTPAEVGMSSLNLSIYTGAHYGGDDGQNSVPPTIDEPNWLFGLKCNRTLTWFLEDEGSSTFVVTYFRETSSGIQSRCIDGQA